jgi:XXXCH domain-containing protein
MEHKIKKALSRKELGRYLHTLANALQRSNALHDPELVLLQTDFDKLELKCKREADGMSIKLKVKTDARRAPPQEGNREPFSDASETYKALKKRMQTTFKRLGVTIAANRIPDKPLIHTFETEVLEMIRFPDRGEPHYDAFAAGCRHLVEACRGNRIEDVRCAFEALNRMKKDCHTRYK